jgi:hypothetical protein
MTTEIGATVTVTRSFEELLQLSELRTLIIRRFIVEFNRLHDMHSWYVPNKQWGAFLPEHYSGYVTLDDQLMVPRQDVLDAIEHSIREIAETNTIEDLETFNY